LFGEVDSIPFFDVHLVAEIVGVIELSDLLVRKQILVHQFAGRAPSGVGVQENRLSRLLGHGFYLGPASVLENDALSPGKYGEEKEKEKSEERFHQRVTGEICMAEGP